MIGFLYPDICNQQGDFGYKDWLIAHGIEAVDIGDNPVSGLTGVVVGDVSERGSEMLRGRLNNHWLNDAVKEGLTVLAIGNSARIFAKLVDVEIAMGAHKSQFVSTDLLGRKLYGFINGPYDLDYLVTEHQIGNGRLIQCALLGPVCVVNPWFENHCFAIQTTERDDLVDHYEKLAGD